MKKERRNAANLFVRECIVDALLQLIYAKPLSAITISELTERAGVSRMTFYRNYNSKEDIFTDELTEIMECYRKEDQSKYHGGIYCDTAHVRHCFEYLYHYRKFLNGLIYCGFGDLFLKQLKNYIIDRWSGEYSGKEEEYKMAAFSGALYGVYISWQANGFREPLEYQVKILNEIYGNKQ